MDFRAYLEKLRGLSDKNKKIVLWTIVAVLGLIMGLFWIKGTMNSLSKLGNQVGEIKFPNIEMPQTEALDNLLNVDQIADWQTYTNEEYGFEIKMPTDWVVKAFPGGLKFTTDKLVKQQEDNSLNCQQGKECDPGELPYAIANFNYIVKDADKYSSEDLVNGISQIELNKTKWARYQPTGMFAEIHFRTLDESKRGYDFMIFWDTDENTLKQALSTFKFIKFNG